MEPDPDFEFLLLHLKETRGFDFIGYKRSSLVRRVHRRMSQLDIAGFPDYVDYLQVHQDEFTTLFNTILINVTGFFRDPEAWEYLQADIVEPMIKEQDPDAMIRVWSAGCASGEEAYTLAMVFAEVLGVDEFRRRVKIYATDVDEEGLTQARQASYTEGDIQNVPPELRERYFEHSGRGYAFRKDLRRSVIFGRNDLVQDAPISRIDLLVCRNTLMYFNAETQSRVLSRFHFAINSTGVLFLGKAEMLLSHSSLFAPVDLQRRVFRKVPRAPSGDAGFFGAAPMPHLRTDLVGLERLRTEAFLASPVAQIVVTMDGLVAMTNRQAEVLFGISTNDVGRPFRDLDVSYRPMELRGYIEKAQTDRRVARAGSVEYIRPPGTAVHLEVQVNPLVHSDSSMLGVTLIFNDVTAARRLRDELELANRQLESAYEELQSTNEELETTNEELQSTVEELETTNEELQSTNEELETMNEELQSTNDELQTINEELRERTAELDDSNAFLESILASLRAGVTVVNRDMQVLVWNNRAEDLWGLRSEEAVGQHFLNLDIGLPTDRLRPLIKQVLSDGRGTRELAVQAVNRRGREVLVQISCSALRRNGSDPTGAILVMELDGHRPG